MRTAVLKRKLLNAGAIWISYIKLIPDLFKLGKNSIVLDCGANVGYISKLLSRTGATVISFEPDPVAFEQLSKRCGNRKNIQLIQKGVWDKEAILKMYSHKDSNSNETCFTVGSSIIPDKKNIDTGKEQSITVIDLVAFLKQLPRKADLIKLDVEGAEIDILHHILATESWHLFDRMYVETHETKIPTQVAELEKIKEQLRAKNITNIKLNWI